MRQLALAIATITVVATISAIARADMVGAAAGAGSGLVVAGPVPGVGLVVTQRKDYAKEAERCANSKDRPIGQLKPEIVAPVFKLIKVGFACRCGIAFPKGCNSYGIIQGG